MTSDTDIATHEEPLGRDRCNFIVRLDLAQDGIPGKFEQMWTRTHDQQVYELCCVPFFTYGLSMGDTFILTSLSGAYRVERKGGHRTIRFAIHDKEFAHQRHEDFHSALSATGAGIEFRGHANSYGAVDLLDQDQANAILGVLQPLFDSGRLSWEWADPVQGD